MLKLAVWMVRRDISTDTMPLAVMRKEHVLEVVAVSEIPKGQLVVPLFYKTAGERGHVVVTEEDNGLKKQKG